MVGQQCSAVSALQSRYGNSNGGEDENKQQPETCGLHRSYPLAGLFLDVICRGMAWTRVSALVEPTKM